jgi:hypothetical protein
MATIIITIIEIAILKILLKFFAFDSSIAPLFSKRFNCLFIKINIIYAIIIESPEIKNGIEFSRNHWYKSSSKAD